MFVPKSWSKTRTLTWYRRRRNQDKTNKHVKFTESIEKFTVFFIINAWAYYQFWDDDWMYDNINCWQNVPYIPLPDRAYWLYMSYLKMFF